MPDDVIVLVLRPKQTSCKNIGIRKIKVLIRKKRKGYVVVLDQRSPLQWDGLDTNGTQKSQSLKPDFILYIRYLNIIYVACREGRLELNEIESNRII